MMSKSIFASKTAWANFAIALATAAGQVFQIPFLQDPQVIGYVTAGVNILLRFLTSQPVTVLPKT